ncbi:ABC transporter D family member 2, chloroplastic-like isoform X2 [Phoenix dactylifera]|uniref:ABC transporter D family member 2, chloroplastic-like isoform X2 n=1 Tax=Phoenix dactylifera TaxID=42345 RepID=A0A8B7BRQ0_PHODC|nr:ABC transporter D family member 2, chloroplastic-like isoform X2 [Phoenix dactylifera]XP_026658763.2 ABC transporter D family member 2, chloroplastic-like isoform X2 [Phoenix dactylifera]
MEIIVKIVEIIGFSHFEKKESDFHYGVVQVREDAESIAFYGGEDSCSLPFSQALRSEDESDKPKKSTVDGLIPMLKVVWVGDVLCCFNGLDSIYEWSVVLSLGEQWRLHLLFCYSQSQNWFYWMSAQDDTNVVCCDSQPSFTLE